jgi:hypothetical protein
LGFFSGDRHKFENGKMESCVKNNLQQKNALCNQSVNKKVKLSTRRHTFNLKDQQLLKNANVYKKASVNKEANVN